MSDMEKAVLDAYAGLPLEQQAEFAIECERRGFSVQGFLTAYAQLADWCISMADALLDALSKLGEILAESIALVIKNLSEWLEWLESLECDNHKPKQRPPRMIGKPCAGFARFDGYRRIC